MNEPNNKKDHILKTAEELFATKGYEAATVRDIADAAGVNLAMISYYFGSKEKLMESLFHERMEASRMKVESLLNDKTMHPFQKVEVILDDYIKKVIHKQSFYKILLCEQVMKKNPVVIKLIRELKLSYAAMFTQLIKEGQKKKIFKKNIDVVLALTTMTGTVTQMIVNKDYYIEFNEHKKLSEPEINTMLIEKLSSHLKNIFKKILGYEE
ncbi:MAG: TetR family transcriptional regulator [Ferruginibacter sp.]